MKKVIIGVLIGIVATIIIGVIAVVIYTKFFMFVPDRGGMINPDVIQNEGKTDKETEVLDISIY